MGKDPIELEKVSAQQFLSVHASVEIDESSNMMHRAPTDKTNNDTTNNTILVSSAGHVWARSRVLQDAATRRARI